MRGDRSVAFCICHPERGARAGARESKDREGAASNYTASGSSTERLSPKPHFAAPILGQVLPARIHLFNQSQFLFSSPALQLLLATNRRLHLIINLVIDQAMNFVLFGESLNGIHFVLVNSTIKVARDAYIERAAAAGENVNPKLVMESIAHGNRC